MEIFMSSSRATILTTALAIATACALVGGCGESDSQDPVSSVPDVSSTALRGPSLTPILECDSTTTTFSANLAPGEYPVSGVGDSPTAAVDNAIAQLIASDIQSQYECKACEEPELGCQKFLDESSVEIGETDVIGDLTHGFFVWSFLGTLYVDEEDVVTVDAGCRCTQR
jgi:hypothetical protein